MSNEAQSGSQSALVSKEEQSRFKSVDFAIPNNMEAVLKLCSTVGLPEVYVTSAPDATSSVGASGCAPILPLSLASPSSSSSSSSSSFAAANPSSSASSSSSSASSAVASSSFAASASSDGASSSSQSSATSNAPESKVSDGARLLQRSALTAKQIIHVVQRSDQALVFSVPVPVSDDVNTVSFANRQFVTISSYGFKCSGARLSSSSPCKHANTAEGCPHTQFLADFPEYVKSTFVEFEMEDVVPLGNSQHNGSELFGKLRVTYSSVQVAASDGIAAAGSVFQQDATATAMTKTAANSNRFVPAKVEPAVSAAPGALAARLRRDQLRRQALVPEKGYFLPPLTAMCPQGHPWNVHAEPDTVVRRVYVCVM